MVGWELFKASDYIWSLSDINQALEVRALPPVSPRMYTNYRKLHRYGYEQYIPINQLDVRTMEDPIWDRALRGRYPLYATQEPVRLLLLENDEPVQLEGNADQISDGEIRLTLTGSAAVNALTPSAIPMYAEVLFLATGEFRLCEITKVTRQTRRRRVTARATFADLGAADGVLSRRYLTSEVFRVVVGEERRAPLLGQTAQQVYWLFSGMEGIRIATTDLLATLDPEQSRAVSGSRVESLSVESPLEAALAAATPVVIGFGFLLNRMLMARRTWWEGSREKYESQVAQEDVLRLRWERSRREVMGQVDLNQVVREISSSVLQGLDRGTQDPTPLTDESVVRTLKTQAVPALSDLIEAGEGVIEFDRRGVGTTGPSRQSGPRRPPQRGRP